MHPATAHVLQFFRYHHLPEHLQVVSEPFGKLAAELAVDLPPSAETTACLRKLLEAKDCAVRAQLAEVPDERKLLAVLNSRVLNRYEENLRLAAEKFGLEPAMDPKERGRGKEGNW